MKHFFNEEHSDMLQAPYTNILLHYVKMYAHVHLIKIMHFLNCVTKKGSSRSMYLYKLGKLVHHYPCIDKIFHCF